jgi:hypothetical protein
VEIEQAHGLAISDQVADQKGERNMHQAMKSELNLSAPRKSLVERTLRFGQALCRDSWSGKDATAHQIREIERDRFYRMGRLQASRSLYQLLSADGTQRLGAQDE